MAINPIILSIIGALAGVGIANLIPKAEADGSTTILQGEKPIVNVPANLIQASVELPLKDITVTFKRITAPTSKGDPQISLSNNVLGNRLLHFSIINDATFKLLGQFQLEINNKTVLETNSADLVDTDALSLPIGAEGIQLDVGGGVKFNAWDSGAGNVTVMILTGVK